MAGAIARRLTAICAAATICCACDYWSRVADADGEVYECKVDGETVELCYYADSASELATRLGAESCGLTDRWFPLLTNAIGRGCRYACPPPESACNAKQGCYCP